jgi:hypothetical protein
LGSEGSLDGKVTTSRDTLLIWKWAIGQWAPIRARRRHIFTYACILRTCGCVFAPFFPREIASNFKNGNSGVSHSVLLTLSSQSDSLLSRSRHAPFPRHAWTPPCETEKRKTIKFPLILFRFRAALYPFKSDSHSPRDRMNHFEFFSQPRKKLLRIGPGGSEM